MERRCPVSYALLQFLVSSLQEICSSNFEISLFKVGFCLAFFGALLVLVSPSRVKAGGLLKYDVVLANEAVRLHIRKSKTDVFGFGE